MRLRSGEVLQRRAIGLLEGSRRTSTCKADGEVEAHLVLALGDDVVNAGIGCDILDRRIGLLPVRRQGR